MGVLTAAEADVVCQHLESDGYVVQSRVSRPEHFGDEQTIWAHNEVLTRLTKDRGQWFAEVSREGWGGGWFDISDLVAVLPAFTGETVEVVRQVGFLLRDDTLLAPLRLLVSARRRWPRGQT